MTCIELNPETTNWRIQVQVVSRGEVTPYGFGAGAGQYCRALLRDSSGQIRVVAFSHHAPRLQAGLLRGARYELAKFVIRPGRENYRRPNVHEYELHMTARSVIRPLDTSTPPANAQITRIADVADGTDVTIVGVVVDVVATHRDEQHATNEQHYRLADISGRSIIFTHWRPSASFVAQVGDVVRVTDGKIRRFRGRLELHSIPTTQIALNDDTAESIAVHTWYQNNDVRQARPLSPLRLINVQEVQQLGNNDHANICAIVQALRTNNLVYEACSNAACSRRMSNTEDGTLVCPRRCANSTPIWRYRAVSTIGDRTGELEATVFGSIAERFLGQSAADFVRARQHNAEQAEDNITEVLMQRFIFTLRVRVANVSYPYVIIVKHELLYSSFQMPFLHISY